MRLALSFPQVPSPLEVQGPHTVLSKNLTNLVHRQHRCKTKKKRAEIKFARGLQHLRAGDVRAFHRDGVIVSIRVVAVVLIRDSDALTSVIIDFEEVLS